MLVVGASDGKFVLPLAKMGMVVTAVDIDNEALVTNRDSLKSRAAAAGLDGRVQCVQGDIRDLQLGKFDAVWTSCSWHYSHNFNRPLIDFIEILKTHLRPGGLFAAEYMMPVDVGHVAVEHYLEPGEIWGYIGAWQRLWDAHTTVYIEEPRPGQTSRHVHRMGFVVARKPE